MTLAPTRSAALARLAGFVPRAGRDYARLRNFDLPEAGHPHVSGLAPYVRHRIVTEAEVLGAVLGRHSHEAAEKFVQEVFWRSYWKGWLERRPGVWEGYRAGLRQGLNRNATEAGLRADWEAACLGRTGIAAFDAWAQELAETGYLHNHARMWVASIWIFTLRLPWELGADWFLRQLLDGDPASNTLGWRWVAGIQTPGKSYAARAENIARFTEGRHRPEGLDPHCVPLASGPVPGAGPVPVGGRIDPAAPAVLLVTEEDLSPGWLLGRARDWRGVAGALAVDGRSPLAVAPVVREFTEGGLADALARLGGAAGPEGQSGLSDDGIVDWAERAGAAQIVTPWAPVGPAAARLDAIAALAEARGLALVRVLRGYDRRAWAPAEAGFFRYKAAIPGLLAELAAP